MAKRGRAPDPLRRRHLAEEELTPARALEIAEAYLAEGRTFDALAFLAKAVERARLAGMRDQAIAAGDVFLVREIAALLGEDPGAEGWGSVARAAEAAGKERYAAEARRLAEARAGERG
jgi:hypothetical protein